MRCAERDGRRAFIGSRKAEIQDAALVAACDERVCAAGRIVDISRRAVVVEVNINDK